MGKFAKKLGKGVLGAAQGWITSGGSPLGAAAGAAGGAFGGSRGDERGSVAQSGSSTFTLDPMISGRLQKTWDAVDQRAAEPYRAFSGQRVAGLTPDETAAADAVRGRVGSAAKDYAAAEANAGLLAQSGGLTAADIDEFYNPFETDGVRAAQDDIAYQEALAQRGINARAEGASAYGGSREAVARGVTSGEYARTAASTAATMRAQGYRDAAQLASQRAGYRLAGSAQLQNVIDARRRAQDAEFGALDAAGEKARSIEQARADTAYGDYLDERGYKDSRTQMLMDAFRLAPTNVGTTTNAATESVRGPEVDPVAQYVSAAGNVKDLWDQLRNRSATPQSSPVTQAPTRRKSLFSRIPRSASG